MRNAPIAVGVVLLALGTLIADVAAGPRSPRPRERGGIAPIKVADPKPQPTPAPVPTTRELSRFGITWRFASDTVFGEFANGDQWVVGPVSIVQISPPSVEVGTAEKRVINGSMVNPTPKHGMSQGYDSAMYGKYRGPETYIPKANVALGVSASTPLLVQPGSSLVSTISRTAAGVRPQIETAAILTVLDAAPPQGSFRPAYAGNDKTVKFNKSQLYYEALSRLAPVASTPEMAEVERMFERPWIDHATIWAGRYLHPSTAMPDYGREMTDQIGIASLMLNLDFPDSEKETLLVRLVQLGIDFHGIVREGGRWVAGGGHHSGRKWPIMFAGWMLSDTEMQLIGWDKSILFLGGDGQTFYVEETSPGVYNKGYGGYGPQHVGMPEWGERHALRPEFDEVGWMYVENVTPWAVNYRTCCTANCWWGQLLAAHVMGMRPFWNHEALFDYQDRYLIESKARGIGGSLRAWSAFPYDMWNRYRNDYPPVWTGQSATSPAVEGAAAPAEDGTLVEEDTPMLKDDAVRFPSD